MNGTSIAPYHGAGDRGSGAGSLPKPAGRIRVAAQNFPDRELTLDDCDSLSSPGRNIRVTNAGVGVLGQFNEIGQAQMDWLMNINFWGVVHATRAFLPHLSRQPEAHIVNLSSIFGIIAPPGQTAYAAAKFAVRGFSESLRHELQMAASPVKLSVVHPGALSTNIVRNSRHL